MRTFIAVEISSEVKAEISSLTKDLIEFCQNIKWVKPENIHITLKFLGSIPEKKVKDIETALDQAVHGVKAFDVELSKIGVFPEKGIPKVIWIGVDKGKEQLEALAGKIEEAMFGQGLEKETRAFRAHLTLGSIKSPKNIKDIKETVNTIEVPSIKGHISKVIFFKSDLTNESAIHTPISTINLE